MKAGGVGKTMNRFVAWVQSWDHPMVALSIVTGAIGIMLVNRGNEIERAAAPAPEEHIVRPQPVTMTPRLLAMLSEADR